jgi:hypothetical protein
MDCIYFVHSVTNDDGEDCTLCAIKIFQIGDYSYWYSPTENDIKEFCEDQTNFKNCPGLNIFKELNLKN